MNYRDKLIMDSEVGTPDHNDMQMALDQKTVTNILAILYPDGVEYYSFQTEKYTQCFFSGDKKTEIKKDNLEIRFEVPIKSNNFLIGVADCIIYLRHSDAKILLEIKTNITNFGEVLRQMQVYKSYHDAKKYVILYKTCKDPRVIKSLEAQGFPCIKFEDIVGEGQQGLEV